MIITSGTNQLLVGGNLGLFGSTAVRFGLSSSLIYSSFANIHNRFLAILLEIGLTGMFAYVYLFKWILKKNVKQTRTESLYKDCNSSLYLCIIYVNT